MTGSWDRSTRTLALAGVGGDAHSVGLITLARSLARGGFRVRYLATQNSVAQLIEGAAGADAVLVSNMDGHAKYYLADLPGLRKEAGMEQVPWYLGGNPSLTGDEHELRQLRELGFARVFANFVDPLDVLAMLDADLGVTEDPGARGTVIWTRRALRSGGSSRRTGRDPLGERDAVLNHWHTGEAARNLTRNAEALAKATWLSTRQREADAERRILLHPRTGVAEPATQLDLFRALLEVGADVLSLQIDSLTRNNAYVEAEAVLKEHSARPGDRPFLNGYPAVNHGVAALRAMTEELADFPFQVRHSTRDPRLLSEISFAGGVAAFEGGPISYNLPYFRDYPPREAIEAWRYVDALAGRYLKQFGVLIDREFFGVLTATLIPPCIALAVDILEALLAAEEGVGCVSLGYAEQGNRVQDVAAIRALRRLASDYLAKRGHGHVAVHTVFHQYMGAFPPGRARSRALLAGSSVTAALSSATRLMLKTPVESVRIPRAIENMESISIARKALAWDSSRDLPVAEVAAEEELIIAETQAILDAVLVVGQGDVATGVARAVEGGIVDVPFAPSVWNSGRAVCVRDVHGAVRFADPGEIPLPAAIREHHRSLVRARLSAMKYELDDAINEDILAMARGHVDRWPLDGPAADT